MTLDYTRTTTTIDIYATTITIIMNDHPNGPVIQVHQNNIDNDIKESRDATGFLVVFYRNRYRLCSHFLKENRKYFGHN